MLKYFVLISMTVLVSACAVKQNPAKTRVMTPMGTIEYHCPPGQAKKGRC